jgi:hypothetical protein
MEEAAAGYLMKRRLFLAIGCVAVLAVLVGALGLADGQSGSPVAEANALGIILVFAGVLAAGLILTRARPPA